jgi:hypothetical protein
MCRSATTTGLWELIEVAVLRHQDLDGDISVNAGRLRLRPDPRRLPASCARQDDPAMHRAGAAGYSEKLPITFQGPRQVRLR